jgi:hypothetical protein
MSAFCFLLMTPDELVQLGTEVVNRARERGARVRLYGGVAVYARCESIATHPKLQRAHADLDFIAAREAWQGLPGIFTASGFQMTSSSPDKVEFKRGELLADLRDPHFREQASFDLAPRLALDPLTLPLADLLLLKLQRYPFAEKDVQDSIALLLDHRVASGGDEETIDRDYICQLTNRNWGLWTMVFDNTVTLEKILDQYIEPEEAQLVWRRIELIQEVLDARGKSLGWWLRWIPNRRLKWYREIAK